VDHKNDVRDDNRWENLRVISQAQNIQRGNKTWGGAKLRGVVVVNNKFHARIRLLGKTKHLGVFNTAPAAHQAYLAARKKILNCLGD